MEKKYNRVCVDEIRTKEESWTYLENAWYWPMIVTVRGKDVRSALLSMVHVKNLWKARLWRVCRMFHYVICVTRASTPAGIKVTEFYRINSYNYRRGKDHIDMTAII